MLKVNAKKFDKRMRKLAGLPQYLLNEALELTKENTPVKSGYARDHTKKQSNKIVSDYAYAGKLDAGSSKQAPSGFTEPTIKQLDADAQNYIRKV